MLDSDKHKEFFIKPVRHVIRKKRTTKSSYCRPVDYIPRDQKRV